MKQEKELTKAQINRQDFIDNTINAFLSEISNGKLGDGNIYDIGAVRDVVEQLICRDYKIMTEKEFYPFL